MERKENILGRLRELIEEWYEIERIASENVVPGSRKIRIGGPIYDSPEAFNVLKAVLSGWITQGNEVKSFEENFAQYCQASHGVSVNSGSSASRKLSSVLSNVEIIQKV